MITWEPLLVTLVKLVDSISVLPLPVKRPRECPRVYPDRLFLKALIIMFVRHPHYVHELLTVLAEPTVAPTLLRKLPAEACLVLGDLQYNVSTSRRSMIGPAGYR
jgi:hypothetical protein